LPGKEVIIERRFRGPPESGHGGYTCGLLARDLDDPVEVTLRMPPPLERPLAVEDRGEGRRVLRDGDITVAAARPGALELEPPSPVGFEEATAAASRYAGFEWHAFPSCFACGPRRDEEDGLRLFPGPVAGRNTVACTWRPNVSLTDDSGGVRPEFVWAALDCPTAFACDLSGPPIVLAQLTARIDALPCVGGEHMVMAWPLGRDGRKHRAGCAIFDGDGHLLALSQALWIEVKDPDAFGTMANPQSS
jgi:hypothetical protein